MQGVKKVDRQAVIAELRDWATITGQPLPYSAEVIVDPEERGFCVDLVDGAVFWSAHLLGTRVGLRQAQAPGVAVSVLNGAGGAL